MPKISDIEETPNPNAVKFILREPVSNGVAQQFNSPSQAEKDPLAKSLFDVGHVVSVFYMDRMITVEKDAEGDWDELLPVLAVPIRAAESVGTPAVAAAAAVGGAIAAVTSDDPRLLRINEILDEKVRPYLMGETDGRPKDAAWAAAITGVSADTIRTLARRMAAARTMVSASWSLQRADHGEQPYWAVILLAAALGQIGLPGGGFGFGYGSAAGIAEAPLAFGPPAMESLANPLRQAIPAARIVDCLLDPGGSYDYNGRRGTYPDIRLVYWAGGNPFHHHQDINRMRRAWQRPETVIVHEPWWTATARHADIVLPATTTLERNDIGSSHRDAYVFAMQQAIAPVGAARNDFTIFCELAGRLGCLDAYAEGRDESAWLRHLYDRWRDNARTNQAAIPVMVSPVGNSATAAPRPT